MIFDPRKFTAPAAKSLPVFLLLDVSGSMNEIVDPENVRRTGKTVFSDGQSWELVEGGVPKIKVLNDAVGKMIDSFSAEERLETEFLVSIIAFGDNVIEHLPPTRASSVVWTNITADGSTSMGAAFTHTKRMIEDRSIVPSRSFSPIVVLVSDGQPTDAWEQPLDSLISEGRSSKCCFMTMGIGKNVDMQVLEHFISRTPELKGANGISIRNTVFLAEDADRIYEFFRMVTMSAISWSKSNCPYFIPLPLKTDTEEGGYL